MSPFNQKTPQGYARMFMLVLFIGRNLKHETWKLKQGWINKLLDTRLCTIVQLLKILLL